MAEYKSPYKNTVILQDDALNLLMRMTKNYPIAGTGTGIILAPTDDKQHIQIQNALKFYSVKEKGTAEEKKKYPGCICIWDTSSPEGENKIYIQAGNLLNFYRSNEDISADKNLKAGFVNDNGTFILITNEDYSDPKAICIKGFSAGNLDLPEDKKVTAGEINGLKSVYSRQVISTLGSLTVGSYKDPAKYSSTEKGNIVASGIITGSKVRGAVFNDYAEYRESYVKEPGRCIIETGFGDLELSTKRLQLGANIISDTFGFSIGETEKAKTPIAVCGRVLAYPNEDKELYKPGAAVCSGPNGTISLMTREEIKEWPDAIVGYVSEIPYYDTWGTDNIKVNGRIWIKIK